MAGSRSVGVEEHAIRRGRGASPWIAVLGILIIMASLFVSAPARAAGDAQLQVTISPAPVDAAGARVETLSPTGKLAYKVDFSCLTSDCDNATVKFDPTQLDPNHDHYRLLVQTGFSPPVTGGSISGSAATGYTVALGNLAAGQSGSFTVEYSPAPKPGDRPGDSGRNGEYNGWAVANFPIGFQIQQTVTGSADTAEDPMVAISAPVVWNNTTSAPGIAQTSLPAVMKPDTNYSYKVYMASGCLTTRYNGAWGRLMVALPTLCASDYQVKNQLPPGVEVVSAAGNPTISGTVSTGLVLTWDAPAWQTPTGNALTPESGWQTTDGRDGDIAANPRTVTVRFPRENFAPAGQTCNFEVQTGPVVADVAVTYVAMPGEAGEVKRATHTVPSRTLRCAEPFGRATADPKTSNFDGSARQTDGDSPINVPAPGAADNLKQWQVTVANTANVDGVAVVTDNTLDLADAPVYRIETAPTGASVKWTATNGTDTVSGTSSSPVDAPAGYRFATAEVTSPKLAGPNAYPNQTARTNFSVVYKYKVSSTAPGGERRTNEASAVMNFPDNPELDNIPLTVAPHTIQFIEAFSKGDAQKTHSGGVVDGAHQIGIPNSGAAVSANWSVTVFNRSSVPAVPVIDEPNLGAPGDRPVTSVDCLYNQGAGDAGVSCTVEYTLDDGTTGTFTGQRYNAPAGRGILAAKVTGPTMGARNTDPARGDWTAFHARFFYTVPVGTSPGTWTNEANATLTFPGYQTLDDLSFDVTAKARLIATSPPPAPPVSFTATVGRSPLPGGATAAGPGTDVTFTVAGSTANVPADRDLTPQYVFVAPAGWKITQGTASFPAGAVPAGVRFAYRTVEVGGEPRQAVVATWPTGTVFGENQTLPTMTVVARPGTGVAVGTVSRPSAYIGNTGDPVASDVFNTPFVDAPDLDSDDNRTELFATANNSNTGTTVSVQSGMQVLKEICLPDAGAADGCRWIADPDNRVGVAPNSTSIKYRLTVSNTGNTTLEDIVGYDVLPYVGDTGTSDATGSTPRNSTFRESVAKVSTPTNGANATYSDSMNPCRPEVDPSTPGCVDDWDSTPAGAQALRLTRQGALLPGEKFSVEYTAAVNDSPGYGAVACNSFAVKAGGLTTVSEPARVCASIEETDLQIVAGTPQLQQGRAGILPFTVTNLGGAASTAATVDIAIPAGVTATSFTPAGWKCTAVDGDGDPVFGSAVGPATLTCTPDTSLQLNVSQQLNLPVIATAPSFTVTADVAGWMFDGNLENNHAEIRVVAAAAAEKIGVVKDDSVKQVSPGDEVTYTISVTNPLLTETLTGAVVTDELPSGTEFVSASNGGTNKDGQISWALPDLTGGETVNVAVTVRVLSTIATTELVNTANVTAPDPAIGSTLTLSGSDDDRDMVVTHPALSLEKKSVQTSFDQVGQTIDFTFTVTNTGDVLMRDVKIEDQLEGVTAPIPDWPGAEGVLAPGASVTATATYRITQADIDAEQVVNTASVRGTPTSGDRVTAEDNATVPIHRAPGITIKKDGHYADGTTGRVGEKLKYDFTITNTGNVALNSVAIDDKLPGLSRINVDWPGGRGTLRPGQSATATAEYTVTQADVDGRVGVINTATVFGTDSAGTTVTGKDTVTLPTPATSGIQLTKNAISSSSDDARAGDVVTFQFAVTNLGDLTLHDVSIVDKMPGVSDPEYDWPAEKGVLGHGAVVTATATYTLTQDDVDSGNVFNTATVRGTDPDGNLSTDQDTAVVVLPEAPALTLEKTGTRSGSLLGAAIGDVVTYQFTLTNPGNVTLRDVKITDEMEGLSKISYDWPGEAHNLAPGEHATATAEYTITAADLAVGNVTNTATVTSDRGATAEDSFVLATPPIPLPPEVANVVTGLARTGVEIGILVTATVTLLGAGVILLMLRKRRRHRNRLHDTSEIS